MRGLSGMALMLWLPIELEVYVLIEGVDSELRTHVCIILQCSIHISVVSIEGA